jgi:hypothetical protein
MGTNRLSSEVEDSTISRLRRWWRLVFFYFMRILASLNEKYDTAFDEHTEFREIVRAVANAYLWPHTHSAFMSTRGSDIIMLRQKPT